MDADEIIKQLFGNMKDIFECKMSVTDKCIMVSSLPPDKWEPCILWPQYGKDNLPIFGNIHQQAMSRDNSINILDALTWCGLCESNGEGRRAMKNNGIKLNRRIPMTNVGVVLTKEHALPNIDAIVLEFGRNNFGIIELC